MLAAKHQTVFIVKTPYKQTTFAAERVVCLTLDSIKINFSPKNTDDIWSDRIYCATIFFKKKLNTSL
jgi:hypothetical protein